MSKTSRELRRRTRIFLLTGVGLSVLLVAALSTSGARARRAESSQGAGSESQAIPGLVPYPKAKWRLSPSELAATLQTVSHLVIRDDDGSHVRNIYLTRPPEALSPPQHTRAEALSLAQSLQEKAARDPNAFAGLARQFSEDPWTAPLGGDLGTVDAALLSPCFLDALAATPEGSVSRVIHCDLGFHVLYKKPTPPEEFLSGHEIVLGYRGVESIELTQGEFRNRDRASTLERARRLVKELRAHPETFSDVARAESNAESALHGGYIGGRSTYHANARATEFAALRALPEGAISDPIESLRGFVIYRRAPYRPGPRIALEEILLRFDENDPAKVTSATDLATQVLADARLRPDAFAELQRRHCCENSHEEWELGTGMFALEAPLSAVKVGELVDHPVRTPGAYHVMRRVEAGGVLPEKTLLRLPEPAKVDVEALFSGAPPETVSGAVREIRDQALPELSLDKAEAARFTELLSSHVESLATATSPDARIAAMHENHAALGKLLGPERLVAYDGFVDRFLSNQLMDTP